MFPVKSLIRCFSYFYFFYYKVSFFNCLALFSEKTTENLQLYFAFVLGTKSVTFLLSQTLCWHRLKPLLLCFTTDRSLACTRVLVLALVPQDSEVFSRQKSNSFFCCKKGGVLWCTKWWSFVLHKMSYFGVAQNVWLWCCTKLRLCCCIGHSCTRIFIKFSQLCFFMEI